MTSIETKPQTGEQVFAFMRLNERPPKPRTRGLTEIRGPNHTPVGRRYLEDLLETMSVYVDTLRYAGGSFSLMPGEAVRAANDVCHEHGVEVSTGGFPSTRSPRVATSSSTTSTSVASSASTSSRSLAASSRCRSTISSV